MNLIDGLQKYAQEENIRLHMPGHKGRKDIITRIIEKIPEYDVTEITGTDNLHNPKDIIKNTQKRIANIYGTLESYILINGTTGGIISAILSCTNPKEKILVQRDCHKSVFSAAIFGDIEIEYILPIYNNKYSLNMGIDLDDLENKLNKNPELKAVVLTYPTYYGICFDIQKVVNIVHKYNKILIIDEAHGSHLNFLNKLPISAEKAGADIVIQSTHKTLPSFTQSSVLHVCSNRVNIEKLRRLLSMIQSSSPSYLLMSSVENAVEYMYNEGKVSLNNNIDIIRNKSIEYLNKGLKIITKDIINDSEAFDFDETKILISLNDIGISGRKLENILREEYKIQVEMSDLTYINAFITSADKYNGIEKLFNSVLEIMKNNKKKDYKNENNFIINMIPALEKKISLRRAFNSEREKMKLENSYNKVAADFIIPYPPGIPLACPGEIINMKIINILKKMLKNNINIIGIKNGYIDIIK